MLLLAMVSYHRDRATSIACVLKAPPAPHPKEKITGGGEEEPRPPSQNPQQGPLIPNLQLLQGKVEAGGREDVLTLGASDNWTREKHLMPADQNPRMWTLGLRRLTEIKRVRGPISLQIRACIRKRGAREEEKCKMPVLRRQQT